MRARSQPQPAPDFDRYIEELRDSVRLAEERRHEQQAEAQRRKALIENPSTYLPAEFEHDMLDRIFFHHHGPGPAQMLIGGVTVTKHLASYTSNSGKSRDHTVTFSWETDGERHELDRESRFQHNRRNDQERNWGLPPRG